MLTGQELLKLVPNAIGFFTIDDTIPGVIMSDKQGWIIEDDQPRPITRSEVVARGGVDALADDVAELITPETQAWLEEYADPEAKKKSEFLNSIPLTKTGTNTDDSQTKEKAT